MPRYTTEPFLDRYGTTFRAAEGSSLLDIDVAEVIGAINETSLAYFTGFAGGNAGFRDFTRKFCSSFYNYIGATHNRATVDGVRGHLLVPPQWMGQGVPAHAETTYMVNSPRLLWFRCARPAASAGQTTVYDGARIWESLPATLRKKFESTRIAYTQSYPEKLWPSLFETTSQDEVLEHCRNNGVEYRIDRDETGAVIHTSFSTLAIIEDRFGRPPAFANHIMPSLQAELKGGIFPTSMRLRWEDGSAFGPELTYDLFDATEAHARDIDWRAGDVVMIDNTRMMHGARSYFGRREQHLIMTREPLDDFGFGR